MKDYRRTKLSALQQLAAAGDKAALDELARRGIERGAVVNVAALDYQGLRSLVLRWNEGILPEDRARSRELAALAQEELEVRYSVDLKLYEGSGPAPRQPPVAPWLAPSTPRAKAWKRPTESTLYRK
ncbi:MAG: hypothetical protein ACRD3V_16385 [Vicinamibacteria bacterium]